MCQQHFNDDSSIESNLDHYETSSEFTEEEGEFDIVELPLQIISGPPIQVFRFRLDQFEREAEIYNHGSETAIVKVNNTTVVNVNMSELKGLIDIGMDIECCD